MPGPSGSRVWFVGPDTSGHVRVLSDFRFRSGRELLWMNVLRKRDCPCKAVNSPHTVKRPIRKPSWRVKALPWCPALRRCGVEEVGFQCRDGTGEVPGGQRGHMPWLLFEGAQRHGLGGVVDSDGCLGALSGTMTQELSCRVLVNSKLDDFTGEVELPAGRTVLHLLGAPDETAVFCSGNLDIRVQGREQT